jgi:internalin A
LHVSDTDFNDEDLRTLSCAQSLEHLNCSKTKLTDNCVRDLARFRKLEALDIEDTQLSDAGIGQLALLKSLKRLNIGGTVSLPGKSPQLRLSCNAVHRLQAALPNCSIAFSCRNHEIASENGIVADRNASPSGDQ